MPIAILVVGILLLVTAYRGNSSAVFAQLQADVTGTNGNVGFALWLGAILFVGVAGSVLGLEKTSKLFIALILAVFVFEQQGIFTQLLNAFSTVTAAAPVAAATAGATVTATDQPVAASSAPAAAASSSSSSASSNPITSGLLTGSGMLASGLAKAGL